MRFWLVSLFPTLLLFSIAAQEEPVRGFVTVDPFEVRVEAVCVPAKFREVWQIGSETLSGPSQEAVLEKIVTALREKTEVTTPGGKLTFDASQARFVQLTPDLGYVPDEREEIPLEEALVGATISCDARGIDRLTVAWNWRAPGQERVPVLLAAGSERLARFLTAEAPELEWVRLTETDAGPRLLPLPPVKMERRNGQPVMRLAGIGLLALAGILLLVLRKRTPVPVYFLVPLGIAALFGASRFGESVPAFPGGEDTDELVYGLLRNTYHAFDFRDESEIYDVLAESIAGPLLETVYLEVRKGLELEFSGGPRVRIKGIDLRKSHITNRDEEAGAFDVESEWIAVGDVTHWGHSHLRTNRYRANLRIGTSGEAWKITKMQVLDEERTQQVTKTKAPEESPVP